MVTDTPPTKIGIDNEQMPTDKGQRFTWFGFPRKAHLLLVLFGGIAVFLLLHLLAVAAQLGIFSFSTCAQLLRSTDYTRVINLRAQNQEMAAVQIGDRLAGGAPAALVQVITHDPQSPLDVYVFGCAMRQRQPQLIQLFAQKGLIHGTAEITPDSTLRTVIRDTTLAAANIAFLQPLQQNIYHEYTWQRNHFILRPFPGFYPVTSRAEAEMLQQNANKGQNLPWNNPGTTALQMSRDLLGWITDPQARLVSQTADTALIELTEQKPHVVLEVTLKRLIQANQTGLWFVTEAHTEGIVVTQAGTVNTPFQPVVTSPVHFSGVNALIDGNTSATLFNHMLIPVKQANSTAVYVQPNSVFAGTLNYSNLMQGQQGVLLIESTPKPRNNDKESGQILLMGITLN